MPAKLKKKPTLPPIPSEHQALYERYLAPFLKIADQVDSEAENPEFQILSAFDNIAPVIAYIDIISDVVNASGTHVAVAYRKEAAYDAPTLHTPCKIRL